MNDPLNPRPDADLDALFALAREKRPDTSAAEFAFETRLMARLRARPETSSIWAMVSWRMMPFFAACVMGLALWHSQVASLTDDAAAFNNLDHPETADFLSD